jgi:hypothetical protein
MRTFLIVLGLVYAAAIVSLMAIGAYYQISRWWMGNHGRGGTALRAAGGVVATSSGEVRRSAA